MRFRTLAALCVVLCMGCASGQADSSSGLGGAGLNPADDAASSEPDAGEQSPTPDVSYPDPATPEGVLVITGRDCSVPAAPARYPGPCSIRVYGAGYMETVYTVRHYGPRGHLAVEFEFDNIEGFNPWAEDSAGCDPQADGIDSPAATEEEQGICLPSRTYVTSHTFDGDWVSEIQSQVLDETGEMTSETRVVLVPTERGRLAQEVTYRNDGDVRTVDYEYDEQDRVVGFHVVSDAMERRGVTVWGDAGPVLETIETLRGDPWSLRQETEYDEQGRPLRIVEDNEGDIYTRTFTYAEDGSWTEMEGARPSDPSAHSVTRHTYDARGTLREELCSNPDTGKIYQLLRYDECGDPVLLETNQEPGEEPRWSWRLEYDERRRLVRETGISRTRTHTYDEAGNLLSTVETGAADLSETGYDYSCWATWDDVPAPPPDRGHSCLPSTDSRWLDDPEENPWGVIRFCADPLEQMFTTCDALPRP